LSNLTTLPTISSVGSGLFNRRPGYARCCRRSLLHHISAAVLFWRRTVVSRITCGCDCSRGAFVTSSFVVVPESLGRPALFSAPSCQFAACPNHYYVAADAPLPGRPPMHHNHLPVREHWSLAPGCSPFLSMSWAQGIIFGAPLRRTREIDGRTIVPRFGPHFYRTLYSLSRFVPGGNHAEANVPFKESPFCSIAAVRLGAWCAFCELGAVSTRSPSLFRTFFLARGFITHTTLRLAPSLGRFSRTGTPHGHRSPLWSLSLH